MGKLQLESKFNTLNSPAVINRFNFISDSHLRSNVTDTFKYVSFLAILESEYDTTQFAGHMIFKDMIVQSASILECLIHYKIKSLRDTGVVNIESLKLKVKEEYVNPKILYPLNLSEQLVIVIQRINNRDIADDEQFIILNRCAKRIGLFNQANFLKAEKIRILRNKVHLFGLNDTDNNYAKADVDEVFSDLHELLKL